MSTLVIMRHGRSVFNEQKRFAGWTDTPLSETGDAEARRAGRTLAGLGLGFDRAWSSELSRAARTLDLVLETMNTDVPVERTTLLNERRYGSVEGLTIEQAQQRFGIDRAGSWLTDPHAVPPDGGESLDQARARAARAWDELIEPRLNAGEHALVVAHGGILRMLLAHLKVWDADDVHRKRLATASPLSIDLVSRTARPLGEHGHGLVGGT